MDFRTPYTERLRVVADVGGPSLTKQSFKKDCDIHVILAQFDRGGMVSHLNRYPAGYADVSALGDFRDSMNVVLEAEKMFATVPSKVRARFGNDPGAFLDFVSNPDNLPEMVELGLANKKVIAEPTRVSIVTPEGTPNASGNTGVSSSSGAPSAGSSQ